MQGRWQKIKQGRRYERIQIRRQGRIQKKGNEEGKYNKKEDRN